MSLTAYVRYDNTGRIVPGGPIVTSIKPKVGDWVAVDDVITTVPNYKLRGFVRYIKNNKYVAGSLVLQHDAPLDGKWKEVYVLNPACCPAPALVTYYNVAGCERMEYHVIKYDGTSILSPGWVVSNETPECWYIIDLATGPEDVGTVQTIYLGDENNCIPCIDAHTTTTTTTTAVPTTTTTSTSSSTTTTTTTGAPGTPFIATFTVPELGVVSLPYDVAGTYTGTIDWDDGNVDINSYATKSHTYTSAGNYNVTIDGVVSDFSYLNNDPTGTASLLVDVLQWGTQFSFGNSGGAFANTSLTTISAIGSPDLTGITNLSSTFANIFSFTGGNLNTWDVSNITNISNMFASTAFNEDITGWNVGNVTDMGGLFSGTPFNQDITGWNISSVVNMGNMFNHATAFNQDISIWNVSGVTSMNNMFAGASCIFNQDISGWNVSGVTNMNSMFFLNTTFSQPIGIWNTSSVTNMSNMFFGSTFNQDISGWITSSVTDMRFMFYNATLFDQNIGGWDVSNVIYMTNMLSGATSFSTANLDALYDGWGALPSLQSSVSFKAVPCYTSSVGRDVLTGTYAWSLTDGGPC